jgi:hypothetical protein
MLPACNTLGAQSILVLNVTKSVLSAFEAVEVCVMFLTEKPAMRRGALLPVSLRMGRRKIATDPLSSTLIFGEGCIASWCVCVRVFVSGWIIYGLV